MWAVESSDDVVVAGDAGEALGGCAGVRHEVDPHLSLPLHRDVSAVVASQPVPPQYRSSVLRHLRSGQYLVF